MGSLFEAFVIEEILQDMRAGMRVSVNFIIESTTDILNSTGGIALVGKSFQDIDLDFESDTVLKSAEKSILRILARLLTKGTLQLR